jgi:5-methylcytosine-specific restriction endonuclease McrBC regulatory subunit McrC
MFNKINSEEITFDDYINFLLALAEDILFALRTKSKNNADQTFLDKITENLFKLYLVCDETLSNHQSQEWGDMAAKRLREVF